MRRQEARLARCGKLPTVMKNTSSTRTVGIDLGDRKHAICVLDAAGEFPKQESTVVKRSTNAKKRRAAVAALKDWLKKSRSLPLPEIIATLKRKLQGYWNCYGVIGNSEQTWNYAWFAKLLVYKWLNRRSQRKSLDLRRRCMTELFEIRG